MKEKIMKMLLIGAIICAYKVLYAPDELKKEGKEGGQIQWVEPSRGWDENGTNLWTGVSPLPSYNVGIGTATPSAKLHIAGGDIEQSDGSNGFIMHSRSVVGYDFWQLAPKTNGSYEWSKGITLVRSTGNVGIGTTAPSQKLDVAGNIRFSGALMPGGNAGASGNILRSQGPGNPPIWVPTSGVVVYQGGFNSTANVCINSSNWTTHPGVSVTLSLRAGDIVFAWATGAIMPDNNCDGWSDLVWCVVDARIAVNGNDFPDGAWQRISADWEVAYIPFTPYSLAGRFTVPVDGNYTFELQTRWNGGDGYAITAGDNTSALQSSMIILVIRP